jgi:serine protease Do
MDRWWPLRSLIKLLRLHLLVVSLAVSVAACSLVATDSDWPTTQQPTSTTPIDSGDSGAAPTSVPPSPSAISQLPSLRDLVAQVGPAVVAIDTSTIAVDFFMRRFEQRGSGSGVIVRSDGYIITNDHVISDAFSLRVALPDGRVQGASIIGRYPEGDIAVIKIDVEDELPTLEFADSDQVRVGDWVLAIGNAINLEGGPTVTAGIVSARGRTLQTEIGATLSDLIQTDAAFNEGNSGGPLIDLEGRVVGINTTVLSSAQGIGFGINSNSARRFSDDLIEFGAVRRPLIGLALEEIRESMAVTLELPVSRGVLVTGVGDGPGKDAGIDELDVIMEIESKPVGSRPEFLADLWNYHPGDEITLTVLRDGRQIEIAVSLDERP